MKTMLTLLLTLSLSAALLLGCTASAQSAADIGAGPASAGATQQPETLVKSNSETYGQEEVRLVAANVSVQKAAYHDLCAVCADTDCDGDQHCNNGEEWVENRDCNTPCKTCGKDTCDGGADCSGSNSHHNNRHGGHDHNKD